MTKASVVKLAEQSKAIPYDDSSVQPSARVRITVVGIKPLLTHNPEGMASSAGQAKRGTRVPESEAEAEAGAYRLHDGTCGIKGEAFRGSILGAAGAWKAKAKATMKSHLAHIIVAEQLVPLHYADGTPMKEYTIDRRRAIIGKAGIMRSRPCYEEWMATFTVEYDPVLVPDPKIIVDITADAGNRMGVGDNRPQKNGSNGRYRVLEYLIES
jgi:hypothetical protein